MSTLEFSQLLGNYGEFVGAIAIVVTLIYLAIQIRQNTASVKASAYQTWVSNNIHINNAVPADLRKGIQDSAQLSAESEAAFALWNHGIFQLWQATDYLYQMGAVDQALWQSEISRAAGHLSNPGVRQWWDAGGRTQLTPRFVALVESTHSGIAVYQWDAEKGFYAPDAGSLESGG